jgi:transposase
MEDWVTIKNLKAKDATISNRQIAKQLGISHNTVKAALEKTEGPEYNKKGKRISAVEPFREIVFEMVNVKKFRGSRILNEVRSKGYKGSNTAFYDFLRKIKCNEQKHFTPYETAPGEQAQFDWSPYTVLIGGQRTVIYVYSYINAFSRYQILEVSLSQNQGAIFEALESSIIESGGACLRLQTDNAKSFVINASRNNFQWNPRYLNLCGHYGFTPTRSLPGHPWSKGKVEKPFSFIEAHFIAGSSFEDFPDLQGKLKGFQNEINRRVHSTTKTPPVDLFEKESLTLLPLPENKYIGVKEETRKVSFDCLIAYNGSRYSVPYMFAGKLVWIKISKGYYLQVYSQSNKLITSHKLSLTKSSVNIIQEHYKSSKALLGGLETLKQKFLESFPEQNLFLEKLTAQRRIHAAKELQHILSLSKLYTRDDFTEALNKAMEYNVFNHSFISGYLEKNHKQSFRIEPVKINAEMPKGNVKRELSQYKLFK